MKILVVDDSSSHRAIAKLELEKGGYEIVEAVDGQDALEVLDKTPVDLITLYVEMPRLDGYEAFEKIRQRDENKTPVIFVTGRDTLEEREKGFSVGAIDYIVKPFTSGELLHSVDRCLKPETTFQSLTALVVDDSAPIRTMVSEMLRQEGLSVILAEDGRQALDILQIKSRDIDLVVTDIMMPHVDGKELCLTIRKQPMLKNIPVFFMSTLSEKSSILEMFRAGATDYFVKPFTKEEFLARMKVHLDVRLLNKQLNNNVLELKKLNQLKEDFLAICSHDLRNPVTVIMSYVDYMKSYDDLSDQHVESLDAIQSSSEFVLRMVGDLLDLIKLQSEPDTLTLEPFAPLEVVQSCVMAMIPLGQKKQIDIKLENHLQQEDLIIANQDALKRVMTNLLSNAIKFTPVKGKIAIYLEEHNADSIALSVHDSGIGISSEHIPRLFDRFSRASREGTEGENGTGLGLSIVKELVGKQGGNIVVSSKEGEGSCFKVFFNKTKKGE